MTTNSGDGLVLEKFARRRQTGQPQQIVVAGLILVRQLFWLAILVALRARAAVAEWLQAFLDSRADVEHACAEWAEQALVPRRCNHVDRKLRYIERHVAQRLGGIDQIESTVFADNW